MKTRCLDATHPSQLTVEDLAKASPLSDRTRRWLRGSRVTIVPMKSLPRRDYSAENSRRRPWDFDDSQSWYLATFYLAGGSDCTELFPWWKHDARMLVVICK